MPRRRLKLVGLYGYLSACIIGIAAIWGDIDSHYELARDGQMVTGHYTSIERENHGLVRYSYEVNGQQYSSRGRGGNRNSQPGDPVEVWYLPSRPTQSIMGNAPGRIRGEIIGTAILAIVVPGLFTWIVAMTVLRKISTMS